MNIATRFTTLLLIASLSFSPAFAGDHDDGGLPRRVHIGIGLGVEPAADGNGETVYFSGIAPDGPAHRDGLRAGDRVKSAQGQEIHSLKAFMDLFHALRGGDVFKLVVLREGEEVALEITVGNLPLEQFEGANVHYGAVEFRGELLRTLATTPASGDGPFPSVLFIASHPCQSLDLAFPPPNPYKNLIAAFNEAGYATMRIERSGVGDSHGPPCSSLDFGAELEQYRLALKKLGLMEDVDAKRIVLFGHGYGGLVAAKLAAEGGVRAIATYGPIAAPLAERAAGNARRIGLYYGMNEQLADEAAANAKTIFERVIAGEEPTEIAASDSDLAKAMKNLFADGQHWSGRHYSFWRQVGAIDPAAAWRDAGVPVLALAGGADPLGEPEEADAIAAAVNGVRPGEATASVVDGVDHMMFAAEGRKEAWNRYMGFMRGQSVPPEFNDALAELIVGWCGDEVF